MIRIYKYINIIAFIALTAIYSCGNPKIPTDFDASAKEVVIYPDYKDVVIPPNIAPLNFIIKENGKEFIIVYKDADKKVLLTEQANKDAKVQIEESKWKELLKSNKGKDIYVEIFAKSGNRWIKYPEYKLTIANEPIDSYISYRLIEPGYEMYRQLGLYQRNLTNFDVYTIYENNRTYEDENNHCINCHNYQNYSTKSMLFHVRGSHGGTIVANNGSIRKINMKNDSVLSSTVYPSWHPRLPYVVFSSNKTGQVFHMLDTEKIEVLDWASDLVFYDVKRNVIRNILQTQSDFETFPCWSPDGKKVYYTCATVKEFESLPDSLKIGFVKMNYRNLHYNVMSIDFDEKTQTFGTPVVEVDCASQNKSASVPRVSPDGRYLLFTLGDFGQFHIWHRSADLYIKDLKSGKVFPLTQANSKDTESFHCWSSNGRWIAFTSRRDDGSFTRLYLSYFDKEGKEHKAFIMPQQDPMQNVLLLKSYNVPEMTRDAVTYSAEDFKKVIYGKEEHAVKYEQNNNQ